MSYLSAVIVATTLTGCGQTGALYLPEEQQQIEKKTNEELNNREKNADDKKEKSHVSDGSQP